MNPDAVFARHSSSPLAIPSVTGVGIEPTPMRLSTSPLYQLGYPVNRVADLGVEPSLQAYETRTDAGPSAIQSHAPDSNRTAEVMTLGRAPARVQGVVTVGFEPTLSGF